MAKFDWQAIQSTAYGFTSRDYRLSAQETKYLLSLINGGHQRYNWLVGGAKPTDAEWDIIQAFVDKLTAKLIGLTFPTFSPLDLSNLLLWLDATDANTLFSDLSKTSLSAIDGDVAVWADKSGNGYDVSQSSTGKYPLRKADAVRFDGTDDFLEVDLAAAMGSHPYTFWAVVQFHDVSGRPRLFSAPGVQMGYNIGNWGFTSGRWVQGGTPDTDLHLWYARAEDNNGEFQVDGTVVVAGDCGGNTIDTDLVVGADYDKTSLFASMDLKMLIIKEGVATAQEISDMEAYVTSTFGITVS